MVTLVEVSTKELVEELSRRDGVTVIDVPPYDALAIDVDYNRWCDQYGPARVLVVID